MEHCNKSRDLPQRLAGLLHEIREACRSASRDPKSVQCVAVSKGQGFESILELADAGHLDFGENYVQEWQAKTAAIAQARPELAARIRWHFIGHLQSNKAKDVVGQATLIHSVDSLRLAAKLSQAAKAQGLVQPVLWEIKLAEEAGKGGTPPEIWLRDLAKYASLPNLQWQGLMAIPPPAPQAISSRPFFDRLKSLLDEGNRTRILRQPMTELSMGMSHDFPQAIAAGATLVRVGTALFGPRV